MITINIKSMFYFMLTFLNYSKEKKKCCQSQTPLQVIARNHFLTDDLFVLPFFL